MQLQSKLEIKAFRIVFVFKSYLFRLEGKLNTFYNQILGFLTERQYQRKYALVQRV